MSRRVYLDYNATAPARPEAVEAVARALETGGNPSSIHAAGRAARAMLETAREQVATLVKARPQDLVFTSGGTEANNLAIESAALSGDVRRLIVSAIEHPSVLESAMATRLPMEVWPVTADGTADLDWLRDRLARWSEADGRPFAALMLANNETGVIQPVAQAGELIHEAGGWLHVDAVQAAGKLAIEAYGIGADTVAISAHKLGGPAGSGALVVCCGLDLSRRINGGGQERGRRGGTENLAGIVGFGAAAEAASRELAGVTSSPLPPAGTGLGEGVSAPPSESSTPDSQLAPPPPAPPRKGEGSRGSSAWDSMAEWRDATAERLEREAGVIVLGENAERLANTLCFSAPGFSSELQVMALDLAGVMVSSGAACSSGKVKASHVVEAMGRPDLSTSAIRVSGGWATTQSDWTAFTEAWLEAHARHAARVKPALKEAS
jgi:cysteine desulfurase